MRPASLILIGTVLAGPASAGTVSVTIPRQTVAEYHRPPVVGWIEPAGGGPARTLFAWYDLQRTDKTPGTKYLADLRRWWRTCGRDLDKPADGISGPTRAPGTYVVPLPADLPAGDYVFNIEAARENGGRELVSVPAGSASAAGQSELGAVVVTRR